MSLTADQILAARPLPSEEVNCPEWGGEVFIRVMTGFERDEFEAAMALDSATGARRKSNLRARLVVRCACDENGKLLFTPDQADALGEQSGVPLNRCADVALRLNRMTDNAVEELKGK